MSVIIRLQNLPWSANALDIRQFFAGLSIPEGGVHIVGGEQGDAFIAFSTDEDARQAFNLNGGKLKEVQVKLMLSSRTEMQKVIEAARNPLAAFMQRAPAPQPLPAIIPAAIPAIIPELKKEDVKDHTHKRERRRSRSRSRDRKDRSRERDRRDRRRRDRSRSRSRDRRDRRRRDRSHSRERRSKDRDRRSKDRRHSEEKAGSSSNSSGGVIVQKDTKVGIWEDPVGAQPSPVLQQAQALLSSFMPNTLEEARRNLNALAPSPLVMGNRNGFQNQNEGGFVVANQGRDNWVANGPNRQGQNNPRQDFGSRMNKNMQGPNGENKFGMNQRGQMNSRFGDNPRMGFNRNMGTRSDGRSSRFDNGPERGGLLERPGVQDRPGLMERPHTDKKNCCVQLRPFYGGYGEIRRFFQGIFIHNTGIKFINDDKGKRTGIVYIRFATPDGKEEALDRTGGHLKNQTVEVTHLEDSVFDKTIDRYHPDYIKEHHNERSSDSPIKKNNPYVYTKPPSQFTCLAVEDLPLFTKEQDMLKIFSDFSMLSILLINKQRHIVAYIKFTNADDAKKAMDEKAKHVFDGKPLSIRPCPDDEFALISHEDDMDPDVQLILDDEDEAEQQKNFVTSDCVSLSGLPLKTTDRDVSDFFSDVAIVPSKIHLISSNLGFTGQAYCEFSSATDAEVALGKNGLPLGSGTITVTSIPRSEMETTIGITSRSVNMNPNPNPNPVRPFFPRNFGHSHGPRSMGLMGHRPPPRRFMPPPVNPSEMASPGCTILMENVPYKAGLDEILEFFDGFEVPPDNVLRRYNENGTPSGEAKVIFNSQEDAFQALQERHMGNIRDRTVYLSQC